MAQRGNALASHTCAVRACMLLAVAACTTPDVAVTCPAPAAPIAVIDHFHGDRQRLGWYPGQQALTPAAIATGNRFGRRWQSPPLDTVTVNGKTYAPHLYASPLLHGALRLRGGTWDGNRVPAILAASSNGFVYAIAAFSRNCGDTTLAAGTILWRSRLVDARPVPKLDGGVPLGILATPVLDATRETLYVAALDSVAGWQAFALDTADGSVRPGWPVRLDDAALSKVNRNGPAKFHAAAEMSQRGALALSPSGHRLYVTWGSFVFASAGWIAAVDTVQPAVVAAFSSAPSIEATSNGGIWGAGGPTVDASGRVFALTGNSPAGSGAAPGVWGNSLLRWDGDLKLTGTYTPFNYCALDAHNLDLAGSAPLLLLNSTTGESQWIAFGGKQGNAYLVDGNALPGRLDHRPECGNDPATDGSRHAPQPQPHLGKPGPLLVFGPYSETFGSLDHAKMRSKFAYYADDSGRYLFAAGSTKVAEDSIVSQPPSLARLRLVETGAGAPWLALDATDKVLKFLNPGSPVLSSRGGVDPVVWVLDENAPRTASLLDPTTPGPILHAIDGKTLIPLWQSAKGELAVGGKYVAPVVVGDTVFIGTDRVVAYGLAP